MKGLLNSSALRVLGLGGARLKEREWQQVPRINVLPRPQGGASFLRALRGAALLLLLVELLAGGGFYRSESSGGQKIEKADFQIKAVRQELSVEQNATAEIQAQITQLQEQRNAAEETYRRVTADHIKWSPPFAALLATAVQGVTLDSLTASPDGQLVVVGIATDLQAIARFEGRLLEASAILELQSLEWEAKGGPISFTADLKVKR